KVLKEEGPILLRDVDIIKNKLKSLDESISGKVVIGCNGLFHLSIVSIIKQYCISKYHRITLEFYYDTILKLKKDMDHKRADIYISLYCELNMENDFAIETFVHRNLMAFFSENHPLNSREKLSVKDLKGYPMVFWTKRA